VVLQSIWIRKRIIVLGRKKELSTTDLVGPYNGGMVLVWIVERYNLKEVGILWERRV